MCATVVRVTAGTPVGPGFAPGFTEKGTCGDNVRMQPAQAQTLVADDGVQIHAVHWPLRHELPGHELPGNRPVPGGDPLALCLVVVHGFTNRVQVPRVQRVVTRLNAFGAVIAFDMRGHGRSGSVTTLGDAEVRDLTAAVRWARDLGYRSVVTVGFSMGGSVVVRQAALGPEPVDAVVSVSAPAFWYYRGTRVMRLLHRVVERPLGRAFMRARGVRITAQEWAEPLPITPEQAAGLIAHLPLLVVHGTQDHYFPLEHPRAIHRSAVGAGNAMADLWEIDGFAHAESGIDDQTLDGIGVWARERVGLSDRRATC